MVDKMLSSDARSGYPRRQNSKPVSRGGRKSPPVAARQAGGGLEAKPWRQWHTASQGVAPAALEVAMPKKPQWGKWIYFAILMAIVFIAARFVYMNFFWYSADGFVSGKQYNVSPSDTVSIQEIYVSPSDTVKEGQLLVKLSSPALVQTLAKNEAEIARLQSDLAQQSVTSSGNESQLRASRDALSAQMQYLESQYFQETQQLNALRELVQKGASQQGNIDQLQAQHNKTWSEYKGVEAELRSTRSQLANLRSSTEGSDAPELSERLSSLKQLHASIEDQLDALELRAPTTGTVAKVPVSKGDVLRAGEPAVELVDKEELRAYLYFPPAAQGKLHENMRIAVARADGSEIELLVKKIYPSTASLPDEFRQQYQADRSAVVVEASPVKGDVSELAMTSGTPIKGRIPRWSILADIEEAAVANEVEEPAAPNGELKTVGEKERLAEAK